MDTQQTLQLIKQRHNSEQFKLYLSEKYGAQLVHAWGGGMWRADAEHIALLAALASQPTAYLVDIYGNPHQVAPRELLERSIQINQDVLGRWHSEHRTGAPRR